MEIFSYAIWNGNKVIMAMTAVVWVGNMGAQLSGEFTFSSTNIPCKSYQSYQIPFYIRYH